MNILYTVPFFTFDFLTKSIQNTFEFQFTFIILDSLLIAI